MTEFINYSANLHHRLPESHASPASTSSTAHNYFIIILIIFIIMNMSGKIIIIITTTIIIIITNGNLSINISIHTEKKTKIATGSVKLWKLWNLKWLRRTTFENIFIKSLLFHMQRTAAVTLSAKQQYLGISAL
ncbi:hypothetical protein ElyMa_006560100 [Elysia marginata]|uniref:Transmembrane protein n=1 Tax=Elysia marginata TaxID=1093978 RepID=A0AAV4ID30_9GAST|nr:hypothetical protein ElyMa_006560100 [Elysia marginata]